MWYLCVCVFKDSLSLMILYFFLTAAVHSACIQNSFLVPAETRWPEEQVWQTLILWPSISQWVVVKSFIKHFTDQSTVDSYPSSRVSSFVSSGGVRQHRRSVRSHFSTERNGRLPAPVPRSLWQFQDPASQVTLTENKELLLKGNMSPVCLNVKNTQVNTD